MQIRIVVCPVCVCVMMTIDEKALCRVPIMGEGHQCHAKTQSEWVKMLEKIARKNRSPRGRVTVLWAGARPLASSSASAVWSSRPVVPLGIPQLSHDAFLVCLRFSANMRYSVLLPCCYFYYYFPGKLIGFDKTLRVKSATCNSNDSKVVIGDDASDPRVGNSISVNQICIQFFIRGKFKITAREKCKEF